MILLFGHGVASSIFENVPTSEIRSSAPEKHCTVEMLYIRGKSTSEDKEALTNSWCL